MVAPLFRCGSAPEQVHQEPGAEDQRPSQDAPSGDAVKHLLDEGRDWQKSNGVQTQQKETRQECANKYLKHETMLLKA